MRILIVAEKMNSVVWTFAKSLHQQKQDVVIVTSSPVDFPDVPPFPILSPFKTWSLLEGMKFVPRLLRLNPDIVHFFFAEAEHRPRPAQWVISSFAAGLPQRTLAASYFVDGSLRTLRDRAFMRLFDVNTFGTRSQLMRLKRKRILPRNAIAEVLPPLENESLPEGRQVRGEFERLLQTLGSYVLVPDPVPPALPVDLLKEQGFEVLALSDLFRNRSHFFSTGPLSGAERELAFHHARALILADSDLSVLELRRYHELCARTQLPVIVTPYQNELLPGLCRHGKSGWVLDQGLTSLGRLLDEHRELSLPRDYGGYSGHELTDNTLNELLRLYQRAFRIRWT